jgi:hypothetical protein
MTPSQQPSVVEPPHSLPTEAGESFPATPLWDADSLERGIVRSLRRILLVSRTPTDRPLPEA